MSARSSISAFIRTAIVTHVSLSATSLLNSAFGSSQWLNQSHPHSKRRLQPSSHSENDSVEAHGSSVGMENTSTKLPWLDQLHNVIACMFIGGRTNYRGREDSVLVEIHRQSSFENPIISHSGVVEIEYAFRARSITFPSVKTLLECTHVEASEDRVTTTGDEGSTFSANASPSATCSPLKVVVTYRLTQNYGSFLTLYSLLVVTVQVRYVYAKRVHSSAEGLMEIGAPIAMSPLPPPGKQTYFPSTELVAEVVRIEERWNGEELLQLRPVHWSRRLNGLLAFSIYAAFLN